MDEQTSNGFTLAAPLRADCHVFGRLPLCHVLLLNKREVPWFILVPETSVIELCDLSEAEQTRLQHEINLLSRFVRTRFTVTKLNVAAIGNIVAQMHIHVIGRHVNDPWWPNVAWGQPSAAGYDAAEVNTIATWLNDGLGVDYQPR